MKASPDLSMPRTWSAAVGLGLGSGIDSGATGACSGGGGGSRSGGCDAGSEEAIARARGRGSPDNRKAAGGDRREHAPSGATVCACLLLFRGRRPDRSFLLSWSRSRGRQIRCFPLLFLFRSRSIHHSRPRAFPFGCLSLSLFLSGFWYPPPLPCRCERAVTKKKRRLIFFRSCGIHVQAWIRQLPCPDVC